ncbi:hypothetical protein PTTG_27940 [Puccinia triticina 1-1 BBBD Race 1]|uniref:Uncharacterized protein n=1 Tax=Puccinia triticina (isolate 1-1 / race 1 (BBBD)) TaxID=630390 RepID=A0A180GGJ6_PUCT1|nr:hypothetical protein PTTG_27940 [Puccinia triticina 1-1 BBBD Race 1]
MYIPVSRKRKEPNPNPARGIATSAINEEPKQYKQTQSPSRQEYCCIVPARSSDSDWIIPFSLARLHPTPSQTVLVPASAIG